jgi:hypothetical protein
MSKQRWVVVSFEEHCVGPYLDVSAALGNRDQSSPGRASPKRLSRSVLYPSVPQWLSVISSSDPIGPAVSVTGPMGSSKSGIKSMTLITQAQTEQLLANGRAQRAAIDRQDQALDFKPVVKLFTT